KVRLVQLCAVFCLTEDGNVVCGRWVCLVLEMHCSIRNRTICSQRLTSRRRGGNLLFVCGAADEGLHCSSLIETWMEPLAQMAKVVPAGLAEMCQQQPHCVHI